MKIRHFFKILMILLDLKNGRKVIAIYMIQIIIKCIDFIPNKLLLVMYSIANRLYKSFCIILY